MIQILPESGMSLEQVAEVANKFGSFIGMTGQSEQVDFSQIENAELNAIPADHPIHVLLKIYKEYLTQQAFLTG